MGDENPVMKMYEAQAMVIEKQQEIDSLKLEKETEIDRLKREKEELAEKLKKIELGKDIWAAITELKEQFINEKIQQQRETSELHQKIEQNSAKTLQVLNELKQDLDNMKNTQELDQFDISSLKDRLEEKARLLWEGIYELRDKTRDVVEGINQDVAKLEQNFQKGTVTNPSIDAANKPESLLSKVKRITGKGPKQPTTIMLIGGRGENRAYGAMIILSSDRTKWIEAKIQLDAPISDIGAVYLNEEIYVIGFGKDHKELYKVDSANRKLIRLADMNIGRKGIASSCVEKDGYIWIFGGMDVKTKEIVKSVERYDPNENKWTKMRDMKRARSNAAVTILHDRIVISGGHYKSPKPESRIWGTAEYYGKGLAIANMPVPIYGHSMVSLRKKLIVMGGREATGAMRNNVRGLDPDEMITKWKELPPMKYPGAYFAGISLDKEIYAIGGLQNDDKILNRVEIFNGTEWRDGPSLPYTLYGMAAIIIPETCAECLCAYKQ